MPLKDYLKQAKSELNNIKQEFKQFQGQGQGQGRGQIQSQYPGYGHGPQQAYGGYPGQQQGQQYGGQLGGQYGGQQHGGQQQYQASPGQGYQPPQWQAPNQGPPPQPWGQPPQQGQYGGLPQQHQQQHYGGPLQHNQQQYPGSPPPQQHYQPPQQQPSLQQHGYPGSPPPQNQYQQPVPHQQSFSAPPGQYGPPSTAPAFAAAPLPNPSPQPPSQQYHPPPHSPSPQPPNQFLPPQPYPSPQQPPIPHGSHPSSPPLGPQPGSPPPAYQPNPTQPQQQQQQQQPPHPNPTTYYSPTFHPSAPVSAFFEHKLGNNSGWGNAELQTYTSSPQNSFFTPNHTLVLRAISSPSHPDPTQRYTSARLVSRQLLTHSSGCLSATLTSPSARGIWPAFWLLPQEPFSWPGDGEIDIAESWNGAQTNHACVHWGFFTAQDSQKHRVITTPIANIASRPVKYEFCWQQDGSPSGGGRGRMLWLIDGQAVMKAEIPPGVRRLGEWNVVINVAMGGNVCGGVAPGEGQWDFVVHEVRLSGEPDGGWGRVEREWGRAPEGKGM